MRYFLRDHAELSNGNAVEVDGKLIAPADVAASVQRAITDVLIAKTIRAAERFEAKTIILSGGVAANRELRERLGEKINKRLPEVRFALPTLAQCTDNAAMIAMAAYFAAERSEFTDLCNANADPGWELGR